LGTIGSQPPLATGLTGTFGYFIIDMWKPASSSNSIVALLCGLLLWLYSLPSHAFNAAFFYGTPFPAELRIYDAIIVQGNQPDFAQVSGDMQSRLYAYTSLGEAENNLQTDTDFPASAKIGHNKTWGNDVMDETNPAWRRFFIQHVVAPLWNKGFRGIFIDTIDSYQLSANTPAQRTQQEAGIIDTLRQLHQQYPALRIILNRGFEILPQVHDIVTAVAAESLYQGWDNTRHSYVVVNETDRNWLAGELDTVKNHYHLPVIVMDYAAPAQRQTARQLAQKIRSAGFSPWVSDPEMDIIGVGDPEIQPRRIMMLYDGKQDVMLDPILRTAAMPIEHLGYIAEYHSYNRPLPKFPLTGQYAGIILWGESIPDSAQAQRLHDWLLGQIQQGIHLAVLDEFGFPRDNGLLHAFGLTVEDTIPVTNVRITRQNSIFGFEHQVPLPANTLDIIHAGTDSTPLLQLGTGTKTSDMAAYTPWGGYILSPFTLYELPYEQGTRWLVNPFSFFRHALRLPDMPAPDVTTSSGRRLLMAHMDGDGFADRAEFPGSPLAAQVMYDQIYTKYPIPAAVSVIEGETAPWGLYPKLSSEMEHVAREIFRLPNVEIASHSYSHPFKWQLLDAGDDNSGEGLRLDIPHYHFNIQREIAGSVSYINQRLTPAGKTCRVFLWTGNCRPDANAIALTYQLGLLNMNGGDTTITNSQPSLTYVAPLGVTRGGYLQVFAPDQNENIYTNEWTGPFYGYRRVIETFTLTNSPRRLKPVDIYFHTYSASKPASLVALKYVMNWALSQHYHPVFPSEYIRRVADFYHAVMAYDGHDWLFYGNGAIDTLRIPQSWGYPANSSTIAGYHDDNTDRYLSLVHAPVVNIDLQPTPAAGIRLIDANGTLNAWQKQGNTINLTFDSFAALDFTLQHPSSCQLSDRQGHTIAPDRQFQQQYHYQTHASGHVRLQLSCQ
jgi:hypothetical protein